MRVHCENITSKCFESHGESGSSNLTPKTSRWDEKRVRLKLIRIVRAKTEEDRLPEAIAAGWGAPMDHLVALLETYKALRNSVKLTPNASFSFAAPEKFQLLHLHWNVEVSIDCS